MNLDSPGGELFVSCSSSRHTTPGPENKPAFSDIIGITSGTDTWQTAMSSMERPVSRPYDGHTHVLGKTSKQRCRQFSVVPQQVSWLLRDGFDFDASLPPPIAIVRDNGLSSSPNKADTKPFAMLDHDNGSLPLLQGHHEAKYVHGLRRDIFARIVERVREGLNQGREDSPTNAVAFQDARTRAWPGSSHLGLSEHDVVKAVDYVVRVVDVLHRASLLRNDRNENLVPAQTALGRPGMSTESLKPRSASIADPAITISEPHTHLASGAAKSKVAASARLHSSASKLTKTTTTIISRESITEITWPTGTNAASRSLLHASPTSASAYLTTFPTGKSLDLSLPTGDTEQQRSHAREHQLNEDITSFPALRKRSCTNDWMSPPALLDDQPSRELYKLGVDAHGAADGSLHGAVPVSLPHKMIHPHSEANRVIDPTTSDGHCPDKKDAASGAEFFGTSSRNSDEQKGSYSEQGLNTTLARINHGSVEISRAITSVVGCDDHAILGQPDARSRGKSVDLIRGILYKIGQADRSDDRTTGKDTCYEDGRPHLCVHEIPSPQGDGL